MIRTGLTKLRSIAVTTGRVATRLRSVVRRPRPAVARLRSAASEPRSTIAEPLAADDRGASEVVAAALLIGIVVLAVSTIVLVAGPELSENQQQAEITQAQQSLTQFDAEAARVASGSTSSQAVDLGLRGNGGTLDTRPESGHITMTYHYNPPSLDSDDQKEVLNRSLGAVVYENGETTVAYQGGGVWRSDGDGSTMVSPPEITFEGKTLTMHVVGTDGAGSVHSDLQLSRTEPSTQRYPNASAGLTNKVEGALVRITIQSQYYEAWGRYFEDDANTIVQYDHADREATITFVALPTEYAPEAGVVATSGPGELRVEGTGSYVDSYNSSNGSYADTRTTDGSVRSAGEITMYGDAQIDGDAEADKDISVESSSAQIDGNATSARRVHEHDDTSVTGTVEENATGVPSIPPVDGLVDRRVDNLAEENDNNETATVENEALNVSGSNELPPGEYYLETLELDGETLVVNATDGNVSIGVETWVKLHGGGRIRVKGDNEVRLFVNGAEATTVNPPSQGEQELHFYVERDSSIRTVSDPVERSTQFIVFGKSDFEGSIAGSAGQNPSVTGIIIAPAGPAGEGRFHVKHGELYGAVMTGNLTLDNSGEIHFDRSIIGTTIPIAPTVPRLEYLYVTEHRLRVESA